MKLKDDIHTDNIANGGIITDLSGMKNNGSLVGDITPSIDHLNRSNRSYNFLENSIPIHYIDINNPSTIIGEWSVVFALKPDFSTNGSFAILGGASTRNIWIRTSDLSVCNSN